MKFKLGLHSVRKVFQIRTCFSYLWDIPEGVKETLEFLL